MSSNSKNLNIISGQVSGRSTDVEYL